VKVMPPTADGAIQVKPNPGVFACSDTASPARRAQSQSATRHDLRGGGGAVFAAARSAERDVEDREVDQAEDRHRHDDHRVRGERAGSRHAFRLQTA